jgi:preprotein translocase subunit SecE
MENNQKKVAEELVLKFMNLNTKKLSDYSRIEWPTAKECALVFVEEIIEEWWMVLEQKSVKRIKYWESVKEEIKNL